MRRISGATPSRALAGLSLALGLGLALGQGLGCNLTGFDDAALGEGGENGQITPECDAVEPWDDEGARLEALTLERINEARRTGGRCGDVNYPPQSALRLSPALRCAARLHSRDMHDRLYVGPIDPDGDDIGARLAEVGYAYRVWAAAVGAGWTEADAAVDAWLQNPNHCWKLYAREIHEIGVGVDAQNLALDALPEADTDGEVYGAYWTLVVGASR